jgi:hypothetical protein
MLSGLKNNLRSVSTGHIETPESGETELQVFRFRNLDLRFDWLNICCGRVTCAEVMHTSFCTGLVTSLSSPSASASTSPSPPGTTTRGCRRSPAGSSRRKSARSRRRRSRSPARTAATRRSGCRCTGRSKRWPRTSR